METRVKIRHRHQRTTAFVMLSVIFMLVSFAESNVLLQDYNVPKDHLGQQAWAEISRDYLPSIDCCFSLALDRNYLWIGTSAGAVRWNLQDSTYRLFKTDDDWNMKYAEKLGITNKSQLWGSKSESQYVKKWLVNAVERIVVLSPDHVWIDTFKGAMIIYGGRKLVYSSVEDALAALYHTNLRSTLSKVVAIDKNKDLWLLKETGQSYERSVEVLYYDGSAWKRDEQAGISEVRFTRRSNSKINDISVDTSGNLWACNFRGIYRRSGKRWKLALEGERYGYDELRLGSGRTLWALSRGTLAKLGSDGWEVFNKEGRYAEFSLASPYMGRRAVLLETPDNNLWFEAISPASGVCTFLGFDGKGFRQSSFCPVAAVVSHSGQSFAASGDRLYRYEGGEWKQLVRPNIGVFAKFLSSGATNIKIIEDMLVASDGTVYVATNREGILQYRKGSWYKIRCDKSKEEPTTKISEQEQFLISGLGPVPEVLVEALCASYIETVGKELIKATVQQLAEDVVLGEESTSPISYYRLLRRNKKLAKKSLQKKIAKMCDSDYGEGWISLQIASYGPLVTESLVEIAKTGTTKQRSLAIDCVGLMRDAKAVSLLFNLLGEPKKLDRLSYLRLARAAILVNDPRGMELLIGAATTEGDFRQTCREELDRVTKSYDDRPDSWSKEKWTAWWQKHRSRWNSEKALPGALSLATVTSHQKLYKAVAERIERGG